jgi:hypothetical protein
VRNIFATIIIQIDLSKLGLDWHYEQDYFLFHHYRCRLACCLLHAQAYPSKIWTRYLSQINLSDKKGHEKSAPRKERSNRRRLNYLTLGDGERYSHV